MSNQADASVTTSRFQVRSRDGTSIAVSVDGDGPAIVLVHGSFADHATFDPLVAELRRGMTTFAMDRRGFGASGDASGYDIERDFEDVAAVVAAVASRTGESVVLWGHSYGANCAMGGAAIADAVDHLVIYEPSLGLAYPSASIDAIEQLVDAGDIEGAIIKVFVEILDMSDEEVAALRAGPRWPSLLAAGPTIARECRAEDTWSYEPGRFDGITCPTLMLLGSESVPAIVTATERAAAAISDSRVKVLDGHGHFAHKTDPPMVASIIRNCAGVTPPG